MKVSDAFPSTYLRAADLQDRNVTVVIDRCTMEEIDSDHKPVVYFQGKERGLVLNKTNANAIAVAYGDDMDEWAGAEIILFPAMVDFKGASTLAIRVRVPPRRPAARAAVANSPYAPTTAPAQEYNELNPPPHSDVPF